MWANLILDKVGIVGAWLTIGDFNSIVSNEEISIQRPLAYNRCADFQDWIFYNGLIDLGYLGPSFTWVRALQGSTYKGARLDRALCNLVWKERFSNVLVRHLPRVKYDHTLILVQLEGVGNVLRNMNFKFQAAWLTHPGFKEVVSSA